MALEMLHLICLNPTLQAGSNMFQQYHSSLREITCVVPQGSVLDTHFFQIYVNGVLIVFKVLFFPVCR